MNTATKSISELNPGDKIYVPWPESKERPEWWKLPEILTVKHVHLNTGSVDVCETGGLCLQASEFNLVIDQQNPDPGDKITFTMDYFNEMGLKSDKEFTAIVNSVCKDPMKFHPPKCIVTIEGEDYGITFDMISSIEKPSGPASPAMQMELFS